MEKLQEISEYWNRVAERKERLVKNYHDKQAGESEELTHNEYSKMLILEAEIQQIREFMDDLNYLKAE